MGLAKKAAPRAPRAPPPEPKQRACLECKQQKIYCSKDLPKCERCQSRAVECVYASPKKVPINEEAKIRYYEEILKSLPEGVLDALPENRSPGAASADKKDGDDEEDESDEEDEADESLSGQFRQMNLYIRASRGSADTFFQTATQLSGLRGSEAGHDPLEPSPVFYEPGMLPSRKRELDRSVTLPPVDVAHQYFSAQYMYIGTIFAFTDPETFRKQLDAAYDQKPNLGDPQSCLSYAKILVILAHGRLYAVNRQGSYETSSQHDHPPGFGYFAQALALLPDVHDPDSVLGVETLAYVGYFLQNMNRRDAAFQYIGIALRMAISLGLHQEAPASSSSSSSSSAAAAPALSEREREHRRRVWWSIYSLDRILSLKTGHPVSILDEDISVNMPRPLPGEPDGSPATVLRCYTELSRILGEISALIYRRSSHTAQTLIATVHAILQSLNRWEAALPKRLRLDPEGGGGKLSRESISMYLHYYQCINMTARPLLFHVLQNRITAIRDAGPRGLAEKERDWTAGLSTKTTAVISACITAARNTVHVMSKAADYNLVATYGYMDGEHAFSAAIVLTLVYASFPAHAADAESTALGLRLLKRMGDLGNGYVAARYKQLAALWPTVGHGGDAASASVDPPPVPVPVPVPVPSVSGPADALEPAVASPFSEGLDLPQLQPGGVDDGVDHVDHVVDDVDHVDDGMDAYDNADHRGLDLEAIDASGLLFGPHTSMQVEDTDGAFWTGAFTHHFELDMAQLMPEAAAPAHFGAGGSTGFHGTLS